MSQTYITARLKLVDGTILYPQVSLDNMVKSLQDSTAVSVVTTVGASGVATNNQIPTAAAVRSLADTKQNTLVAGTGTEIINGSTINAMAVNLNDVVVNNVPNNGLSLAVEGNTMSVVGELAANNSAGVVAGATNGVTLDQGVVKANPGDGLLIEDSQIVIDEASVETTLLDVRIEGASTVSPVDDQVLTPGNLRGALSVGQAVDVSCAPLYEANWTKVSLDGGETWVTGTADELMVAIEGQYMSSWSFACDDTEVKARYLGFNANFNKPFPKYAAGLKYLFMMDIRLSGTSGNTMSGANWAWHNVTAIPGIPLTPATTGNQEVYTRIAGIVTVQSVYLRLGFGNGGRIDIKNWRQYEVTALTDEAIAYIAQLPDPDAFFRSASIYSLRDKYLVKQDMVCPFIPTISMPDNSDLTVAAGLSYKIKYTNDSPHNVTVDTIPTDAYGWDAHIQMFIKGTSSVVFQKPLILMDALTPNAGHNLLVKFRNGDALVYVDDIDIGYVVSVTSGTTDGSLTYALANDVGEYVVFSHETDGSSIAFPSGVTVSRSMSIIGNGPTGTYLTGDTLDADYSLSLASADISGLVLDSSAAVSVSDVKWHDVDGTAIAGFSSLVIRNSTFETIIGDAWDGSEGSVSVYGSTFTDASIAVNSAYELYVSYSVLDDVASSGTLAMTGDCGLSGALTGSGIASIANGSISGAGTVSLAGSTAAFTATNASVSGITITGASTSTTGALVGQIITLQNVTVSGNTVTDADGTLAITGSTSAVSVPHAAVEVGPEGSFSISGGSYVDKNDVLVSGYSVACTLGGTVSLAGRISAFGSGNSLTIADNTVIDMTGNTNTTAIAPGGDIIVGTGVKAVTTDGSTVNVTGGTYKEGVISNAGVASDNHHIYGFDRQVTLNNPAVSFVELTDTSASGSSRYTSITAADWKNLKKGLLETRACVMYSNKTTKPGGKKNKVMFYLSNSDFRYKENGQKLTAQELLGKVMWDGALRLCNFMKIYPKLWIKIEEYGDPCIFSQTSVTATSQVAWKRDPDSDVSGASFGWKNGSTVIWTATVNPAAGDKTYSNNTCTTERDWPVVYYCLEHFVVLVSDRQDTDFILHPWFWTSEDGQTASDQYVGMFKGVACDANGNILTPVESTAGDFRTLGNPAIGTGMVRSIPGGRPACSNSLNAFRQYIARSGVDVTNAMFDWYKDLMLVFDTGYFDAQSRISGGLNLIQAYYWFELRQTGRTMQFGNRTCSLNADGTLDADIAAYWNGRITSKAASTDSSVTTWQRNPANDKITNDVASSYAWTAKVGGVDTYIWTAAAEPAADAATYSDNTLSTVRTGCPVVAYTNGAGVRCTTFSWRGLEDIWGACWEFRDGVQKRQDAVNTGFTDTYIESGYMVTNAISLYTSTDLLPSPSDSVNNLPKTVTASLLTSSITYANSSVSIVKDWDKLSGTGTGLYHCFVQHPWPKKGGQLNVWDPLTNYPVMVAASALNSAYGDSFYNDALAGSRVLFVGGHAGAGGNDGPGYVSVLAGLGTSGAAIGVRPAASEN